MSATLAWGEAQLFQQGQDFGAELHPASGRGRLSDCALFFARPIPALLAARPAWSDNGIPAPHRPTHYYCRCPPPTNSRARHGLCIAPAGPFSDNYLGFEYSFCCLCGIILPPPPAPAPGQPGPAHKKARQNQERNANTLKPWRNQKPRFPPKVAKSRVHAAFRSGCSTGNGGQVPGASVQNSAASSGKTRFR